MSQKKQKNKKQNTGGGWEEGNESAFVFSGHLSLRGWPELGIKSTVLVTV